MTRHNQPRPFVFEFRERRVNIGNFNCNMVHSRSAFGEKLPHGCFRPKRLEEFNVSIANGEHTHPYALFSDLLGRIYLQTERVAPDLETLCDTFRGNANVVNFEQPELSPPPQNKGLFAGLQLHPSAG